MVGQGPDREKETEMRYQMPHTEVRKLALAYWAADLSLETFLANLARAGYGLRTARLARQLFPKGN